MASGGYRGRGRNIWVGRRRYKREKFDPQKSFHPFDLASAETAFPHVAPIPDESDFISALLERNSDLSPTPAEQTAILKLVKNVLTVLDNLVKAPENFNACQLEEVVQVGSFKYETMVTGNNVADIVVILQKLPTQRAVEALGKKIKEDFKNLMKSEMITIHSITDCKIEISSSFAAVRVLFTTYLHNTKELPFYPGIMLCHLAATRHSRWFEENGQHSSVKVLIRLLKDLKTRFDGFEPMTPWMLVVLAHYAVMNNPRNQALPINQAFKRVFQLLSAGMFLPGSAGIIDPCEGGKLRVYTGMTLRQLDICCLTAQTLLRMLSHGAYKQILGLEETTPNVKEISILDNIIVAPSPIAYVKCSKKKGEEEGEINDMEVEVD